MGKKNLLHTKKKLTIIFTLLVFSIAVLLEFVFFSAKYYNYINNEEKDFIIVTSAVENKYVSLEDFVNTFDVWKRLFKMWEWLWLGVDEEIQENHVNLLIIDKDKNELVFSNIIDNLSIEFVEKSLNESVYWIVKQDRWYFIKKINVEENNNNYDVLFIKVLRYSFWDYLKDILQFVYITLIFSVFFYYIWYLFVSKNLEPVENNLNDMHDFIHNAWHELKTPISIIHSNLQLINQTKVFEKDLVDEWLIEINRLNNLIESLVELSSVNNPDKNEKIKLNDEILLINKDFTYEAKKKKIDILFINNYDKFLTINKQYFYILYSNLLWNAIKYSNNWWKIIINLNKNSLSIKDNWIWIGNENIDKIFDRFFMWEKSRNTEWHGIWLSLVKKIIWINKWKIKVQSIKWKWSTFTILF